MRKLFKEHNVITTDLYLDIDMESLNKLRAPNNRIFVVGEFWRYSQNIIPCYFDERFKCFRSERVQIQLGKKFRFVAQHVDTTDMKNVIVFYISNAY